MSDAVRPTDRQVLVADGLTLHLRDWSPAAAQAFPVLCLPGLSRTLEDFCALAGHLASAEGGGHRVLALSARGRGLSERDPDPTRYQVKVESEDAIAALAATGVAAAAIIGTSRGGLQAMTIAALRPDLVKAVVLNDIGPEIEAGGLGTIRDALSDPWRPASFAEAADRLRLRYGARFAALGQGDWDAWARRSWREKEAGLEPTFDPALVRIFDGVDLDQPLPDLWPFFEALKDKPLMVVRGEHSDILSEKTLKRMIERRPGLLVCEVAGQGHAPLLDDRATIDAIAAFLSEAGC